MQRSGSAIPGRSGSMMARAGSVRVTKAGSGRVVEEVVNNKTVSWLDGPSVWVAYVLVILLGWLGFTAALNDSGLAWTYVHLVHGVTTYYLLHWIKGSYDPVWMADGAQYDGLTIWEQMDNGVYGTINRKVFTIVPLLLFLAASHGTELTKQPVGLNLAIVVLLLFAKLPYFYKVRIFGINK